MNGHRSTGQVVRLAVGVGLGRGGWLIVRNSDTQDIRFEPDLRQWGAFAIQRIQRRYGETVGRRICADMVDEPQADEPAQQ